MTQKLPDWVLEHKTKGIAIEKRGNSYYASKVTSVWNPSKGRAQKKTLEYLGKVTPDGIIPPRHKRELQIGGILEAGHFAFLERFIKNISGPLVELFPDDWESILSAACIRLCYQEPFSRMKIRHDTSLSKRFWPTAALSKNSLTQLLPRIGRQWNTQRDFFSQLSQDEKHMAIDLSHIFSNSQNIQWLEVSHNPEEIWRPQFEILLMWGTTTHQPGFLKLLPGATHSAKSLSNAIWESGIQDVVAIMDKGFYSQDNIECLEDAEIQYAIALKRDLSIVKHATVLKYKQYFHYKKHVQWWRSTELGDGRMIYHFLDKTLADNEESSYLARVEEGKATKAQYNKLKKRFGTLSIITDTGLSAKEVYALYKQRRHVEYAFEAFKKTLEADVTWMRSRESLQGYLFINFVALHLYSQVLDHLKRRDLLERYSVQDILTYLSKVCIVEVNGKDRLGEVSRQTQKVIDLLEIPITERLGL